jgi:dynamin 1-like protein
MDRGTNALDVLTGKALPIKLGIVGVVNRAEADREKSLEDAEVYERTFLEQNYPTIAHKNGCPYLTTILNKVKNTSLKLRAILDPYKQNL